ncbi:MAG: preprotein translocase subunit SecA [Balneolaceae bacterium]|nr:preprotein translocase subunit SecA [Balneolaceae bacterium]
MKLSINSVLTTIFGSKSEQDLKSLSPILEQIHALEPQIQALSDEQLKGKTAEFKQKIVDAGQELDDQIQELRAQSEDRESTRTAAEAKDITDSIESLRKQWLERAEEVLEEILPEAYAVLKETCRRFVGQSWMVAGSEVTWQMVPYDVQLMGAVALHRGMISEMKTGEGKTLVAIFPAYLNALVGRGVHIITVNDYLAKRDAEWNEPIFNFLGLRVDCIDKYQPNSEERREAYRADVTYGTNNEFGFDYLRDNMVVTPDQLVQRGHHFTIIDEVDSILIDEARTPLIISGPVPEDNQSEKYIAMKPRIDSLVKAQQQLVAGFVTQAEKLEAEGDAEGAGLALLRAQRGYPKNRKLRRMLQDMKYQSLLTQSENFYLQENAKRMPEVDEELFYAVEMRQRSIEMSDKGREFITKQGEDADFFIIPDVGEETVKIEEEANAISDSTQAETFRQERLAELNKSFAEKSDRIHTVNQLLKAYTLFVKDEEYIVQEGKVQIVDEHTGRVMSGRRYSDGLHQAIEAKENVRVEAATQTYATITLQNFFRMYHKLSGMTGTAATEEGEFNEIYGLDVVVIPTNKPIARLDREDLIYRSKREKFNAVIEKIREVNKNGQPVLVGTTSVDVSETLSRMLKRSGIDHNVLNAKQNAQESEVVAIAGQPGAVTVATNMAGRGTDIKLTDEVVERGGLVIIGTERHDSRRIDLQLRGRAGRQGDPGETQFYVSLEDQLMALFGGTDRIAKWMDRLNFQEGEVIQHSMITKSLERAQKKVEQNNFSIRKRQLEYDDVLNNQRNVIYDRRRNALLGENVESDLLNMLDDFVSSVVSEHFATGNYEAIAEDLLRLLALPVTVDTEEWVKKGEESVTDELIHQAQELYRVKESRVAEPLYAMLQQLQQGEDGQLPERIQVIFNDGSRRFRVVTDAQKLMDSQGHELLRALERSAILSVIDDKWMEHLRELDAVKEGIGLRAFGQKDPLVEYKREAFEMFQDLLGTIHQDIISMIWRAVPEARSGDQPAQRLQQAQAPKAKVELSKAKTQHQETTNMGFSAPQMTAPAAPSATGISGSGARATSTGPLQAKKTPEVVESEPGRNDIVTMKNVQSGETKKIKWKVAKRMQDQGWVRV